jgi:HSP20 family protein
MVEYIKIRFGDDLDRTGSRFEEAVENMFRSMGPMFSIGERSWKPQMDVYETADEIILLAELAGIRKDDLDIEVNSKAIKIAGGRKIKSGSESCKYRLAEIQYGNFERIIMLPGLIDPEKVDASFQDGFLTVRLSKKKQIATTTKIHVTDE